MINLYSICDSSTLDNENNKKIKEISDEENLKIHYLKVENKKKEILLKIEELCKNKRTKDDVMSSLNQINFFHYIPLETPLSASSHASTKVSASVFDSSTIPETTPIESLSINYNDKTLPETPKIVHSNAQLPSSPLPPLPPLQYSDYSSNSSSLYNSLQSSSISSIFLPILDPFSSKLISIEQAIKDFIREKIIFNSVPFISDKKNLYRSFSFFLTLELLILNYIKNYTIKIINNKIFKSYLIIRNYLLQRSCRTSMGLDCYTILEKILCIDDTVLIQKNKSDQVENESPIYIDIFLTPYNKFFPSISPDLISKSSTYSKKYDNEIKLFSSPSNRSSSNISSSRLSINSISSSIPSRPPSSSASASATLLNNNDEINKIRKLFDENYLSEDSKTCSSSTSISASSDDEDSQLDSQDEDNENLSNYDEEEGNKILKNFFSLSPIPFSFFFFFSFLIQFCFLEFALCARTQVSNSFAIYDLEKMDSLTGSPNDPKPW